MEKIRLLCSPDPVALERAALSEVAQGVKNWPLRRAFIIVPEYSKVDTERSYFTQTKMTALLMAEVLSFKRLAHRIFNEAGGLAVDYISDAGKKLLIQNLIRQSDDSSFPWLHKLAKAPSFADNIVATLKELKDFGITGADLANFSQSNTSKITSSTNDRSVANWNKIADLARLEQALAQEIKSRDLYDAVDDRLRATELVKQVGQISELAFLQDVAIWVVGYGAGLNLKTIDLAFLEVLHQAGASITATVVCDEDEVLRLQRHIPPHNQLAHKLVEFGDTEIVTVADERIEVLTSLASAYGGTTAQQKRLQTQLAASTSKQSPITVVQAISREQELSFVAGEIVRLHRQEGVALDDIAIAMFDSSKPAQVKSLMQEYGIAVNMDERSSLQTTEWQRFLSLLLQMVAGHTSLDILLDWLQTGLLGLYADTIAQFGNMCQARSIKSVFQIKRPRYLEDLQTNIVYTKAVLPLLVFLEANKKSLTGKERLSLLEQYIEQNNFEKSVEERGGYWQDHNPEFAQRLSQAFSHWQSFAAECENLMTEATLSPRNFAEMISSALGESVRPIPHSAKAVRVGNPDALVGHACTHLFLTGLTATTLLPQINNPTLLSDDERKLIEAATGKYYPERDKGKVFEFETNLRFLFSLPRCALYLTTPTLDAELQSPFITDLKKMKGVTVRQVLEIDLPDVRWLLPSDSNRLALHMQKSASFKQLAPALKECFEGGVYDKGSNVTKPAEGCLEPDIAKLIADKLQRRIYSPTQLERYAKCPYDWFINNVLYLNELPTGKLRASEVGTLLHAVMQLFFEETKKKQEAGGDIEPLTVSECEKRLIDLMTKKDWFFGQQKVPEFIVGRHVKRLATSLQEAIASEVEYLSKSDENWLVTKLEEDVLIEVATNQPDGKTVKITGQIDRIDTTEDSFRIVDYKSSKKQFRPEELAHGIGLQMPLYAVAWEKFAADAKFCKELEYVQLLKPKSTEATLVPEDKPRKQKREIWSFDNADDAQETLNQAKQKTVELVSLMEAGQIAPAPLELKPRKLPCTYCKAKAICGFDHRDIATLSRNLDGDAEVDDMSEEAYNE